MHIVLCMYFRDLDMGKKWERGEGGKQKMFFTKGRVERI